MYSLIEPTIYHTWDEHAYHYTTDAVFNEIERIRIHGIYIIHNQCVHNQGRIQDFKLGGRT